MPKLCVAIHQPNFFPWLGYFDKTIQCDRFVFLDHVQFPKKGGVWTNRVKLLINGDPRWVTAPVDRTYHGVKKILDVEFVKSPLWRSKLLKTLEANYRHSYYYHEVMDILVPLIEFPVNQVAQYNINAITALAELLKVPRSKFICSSELNIASTSTEMLIEITRKVGGTSYLCGGGADEYQEDTLFARDGIELVYQNFRHPTYHQRNVDHFGAGLSIIDAFFQVGFDGTKNLLMRRSP